MIAKERWFTRALNRWARKRHGQQRSPVVLLSNRIYILPSKSGMVFTLMLLIMLLGSMNYNNSMGLGLSFLLGSLMLVSMHHCHRNLLGLRVTFSAPEAVFAQQNASITVKVHNDHQLSRSDLVIRIAAQPGYAVNVDSQKYQAVTLSLPTTRRGYQSVDKLNVRTRYPGGLFRSWTWIYWDLRVLVYPAAHGAQPLPAFGAADQSGQTDRTRGDEELAELRSYVPGDPLNHVAWKQFARTGELHSKTFDGPQSTDRWLEWKAVHETDTEARLEQLCAWVVESHAAAVPYGLRLPTGVINPDTGEAHRDRCLTELALYDL